MIVVDASVLIAFLDPNDAHHSAAVEILEEASPPLFVHPITAAEVLVAAVRNDVADAVWADLMAIGVELDDTPNRSVATGQTSRQDPLQDAQLLRPRQCRHPQHGGGHLR